MGKHSGYSKELAISGKSAENTPDSRNSQIVAMGQAAIAQARGHVEPIRNIDLTDEDIHPIIEGRSIEGSIGTAFDYDPTEISTEKAVKQRVAERFNSTLGNIKAPAPIPTTPEGGSGSHRWVPASEDPSSYTYAKLNGKRGRHAVGNDSEPTPTIENGAKGSELGDANNTGTDPNIGNFNLPKLQNSANTEPVAASEKNSPEGEDLDGRNLDNPFSSTSIHGGTDYDFSDKDGSSSGFLTDPVGGGINANNETKESLNDTDGKEPIPAVAETSESNLSEDEGLDSGGLDWPFNPFNLSEEQEHAGSDSGKDDGPIPDFLVEMAEENARMAKAAAEAEKHNESSPETNNTKNDSVDDADGKGLNSEPKPDSKDSSDGADTKDSTPEPVGDYYNITVPGYVRGNLTKEAWKEVVDEYRDELKRFGGEPEVEKTDNSHGVYWGRFQHDDIASQVDVNKTVAEAEAAKARKASGASNEVSEPAQPESEPAPAKNNKPNSEPDKEPKEPKNENEKNPTNNAETEANLELAAYELLMAQAPLVHGVRDFSAFKGNLNLTGEDRARLKGLNNVEKLLNSVTDFEPEQLRMSQGQFDKYGDVLAMAIANHYVDKMNRINSGELAGSEADVASWAEQAFRTIAPEGQHYRDIIGNQDDLVRKYIDKFSGNVQGKAPDATVGTKEPVADGSKEAHIDKNKAMEKAFSTMITSNNPTFENIFYSAGPENDGKRYEAGQLAEMDGHMRGKEIDTSSDIEMRNHIMESLESDPMLLSCWANMLLPFRKGLRATGNLFDDAKFIKDNPQSAERALALNELKDLLYGNPEKGILPLEILVKEVDMAEHGSVDMGSEIDIDGPKESADGSYTIIKRQAPGRKKVISILGDIESIFIDAKDGNILVEEPSIEEFYKESDNPIYTPTESRPSAGGGEAPWINFDENGMTVEGGNFQPTSSEQAESTPDNLPDIGVRL